MKYLLKKPSAFNEYLLKLFQENNSLKMTFGELPL